MREEAEVVLALTHKSNGEQREKVEAMKKEERELLKEEEEMSKQRDSETEYA
jgi:hypothetical protein